MSSSDPRPQSASAGEPAASEPSQPGSAGQGGRDPSVADRMRNSLSGNRLDVDDSDEEQELWQGGYSPKAMVGSWLLLAAISVALLSIPFFISGSLLFVLGVIPVLWIIVGAVYAWRRLGVHYELTTQRFIHQTGVLSRRTDRIEVIDIDDVTCSQGPIQRLFGIGTIVLTGSDRTHPTLSMIGIADCRDVAALIDEIRRKERRRRSLHIEAV